MMEQKSKVTTMVISGIVGAAVGVLAALIMIKQAEKQQKQIQLSPSDGVKLGLGVFTLLRLIADMINRD
jgi:hypothetical protein